MKPLLTACLDTVLSGEHEPFAVNGRCGKPAQGFITVSKYLWTHPLLTMADVGILGIISSGIPFSAPCDEGPQLSTTTLQDIRMQLGLGRTTVYQRLNYLVELGLVIRDDQRGQKDIKLWLTPGPWPMLGDTPGHPWRLVTNQASLAAKRWLSLAKEHGPSITTMDRLVKELPMLNAPKKVKPERESLLDAPTKNNNNAGEPPQVTDDVFGNRTPEVLNVFEKRTNVGGGSNVDVFGNRTPEVVNVFRNQTPGATNATVDNFSSSTGETPSPTQKTCLPASGARAPYIYIDSGLQEKNTRLNIASLTAGDTEQAGATPGKPTGCVSKKIKGSVYPIPVVSENIGAARRDSSRKIRHDTIAKAALSTPPPKTRRRPNTTKQFEYKYRAKVEEMTDIVLPDFLVSERSQVKQSIKRYGAETMLKALDWVFDNWTTLQSRNHKLYSADKFPPLKSLTAARLLNPILPYVQKGEPMPEEVPYTLRPENKNYWAQSVSKLNAEREAAGGGVDVLVEWAKQRERGDV